MIATTHEELEARVDALQVAVDRLEAAVVDLATALAERRQQNEEPSDGALT